MNRDPGIRALAAVLCLGAAGLGYWLAGGSLVFSEATPSSASGQVGDTTILSNASSQLSPAVAGLGRSSRSRSEAELIALKKDLRSRFAISPFAFGDLPLREQTAAILATMSADELEAFAHDFDKEPVDAMFPTPDQALLREIMRQWAIKDPGAASLNAAKHPERPASHVFEDWLKRDLAAAEAWLKGDNFADGDKSALDGLRKSFLKQKGSADFDSARQYWSSLDQERRDEVLIEWGETFANDLQRRSELLGLLQESGDDQLRLDVYKKLAGTMAVKSPKDAVEFVENSDLPEASKDALYDKVLGHWSEKDPKAALDWWKSLGQNEAPPKGLNAGIFKMVILNPDEATKWVRDLPPGPARDGFEDSLMENLLTFHIRNAADFSASIQDPARRHKHLREVFRQYSEKGSEFANRWLDGLPEEDRTAVRNP